MISMILGKFFPVPSKSEICLKIILEIWISITERCSTIGNFLSKFLGKNLGNRELEFWKILQKKNEISLKILGNLFISF